MQLDINSRFDGGNIQWLSAPSEAPVRLAIRPDAGDEFLQWFYFRLSGLQGQPCVVRIENAGRSSYPKGWQGYDVTTSVDRQHWFRLVGEFDGDVLQWSIPAGHQTLWFAYFAPFSLERHADLIARCGSQPGVEAGVLGESVEGRPVDYLQLLPYPDDATKEDEAARHTSQASTLQGSKPQVWSIARQHPGESMAAWWMQGWLDRLTDPNDAAARALRRMADIHVVPNMNPDGVFRGYLRTNAAGANLNREWADPSPERSPEVFCVRQRMQATGVSLSLDVHGDEILPYNFIAGTEGVASWSDERDRQLVNFKQTLAAINPDFQFAHGYPRAAPGKANLTFCSNQLAQRFGALAMTLEMPFKDTADHPRPGIGWSPERCQLLGRACVEAVLLQLTGTPSRRNS